MKYRKLGKTEWSISEISLGTWQVGGGWGKTFDDKLANRIIHTAIDKGINFMDTADVYDGGLSEAAVGKAVRESPERIFVATKCGRQIQPHINAGYTPKILRAFVEGSLQNTGLDGIDLIQLHCPPTPVYMRDEIFELFEKLKEEGKIHAMGVSVETVDEALAAMKYEIVSSIQIIFNMFRLKPSETLFSQSEIDKFGIIARVPLASGLLTGKLTEESVFSKDDHREFNRHGEAFDKGETFSGVDYQKGLQAVEELKELFQGDEFLATWAIRWVLMFPQVSTVIPGASKVEQVINNVEASQLPEISISQMEAVRHIYSKYFKADIHHLW
ncbi:aldo/keto reductase [Aquiflexum sp. TKW24L]|uniref:aldo/keto reductase n=1 Tax=Aquiflexum sp. TKW24L TaxID=2942212 RepID=UPI0020BE437A|nr:aldo/keto reductase [Aquiflexum sp. TKW24L]MCL6257616.1 aldo/keto reductase [Aquiflexum sp. TKW24L]